MSSSSVVVYFSRLFCFGSIGTDPILLRILLLFLLGQLTLFTQGLFANYTDVYNKSNSTWFMLFEKA